MRPVGLLLVLPGCSLLLTDVEPCQTNAACREAFGLGFVCADDGLCHVAPAPERCDEVWPPDLLGRPANHIDTVVLGALVDRSVDEAIQRAYELAVLQADDAGGLGGAQLGIVHCTYEDDGQVTTTEAVLEASSFLVGDLGAPVVLGPSSSALTAMVWEQVGADAVVISPSATSPALTFLDGVDKSDANPGTLWRTAPPDSVQGRAIADDLRSLGATAVAVVYQEGPYGLGLSEVFVDQFADGGHTVVQFPWSTAAERDEAVADASSSLAGVALFISSELTDGIAFLNAAAVLSGFDGMDWLYLTDGAADVGLLAGTNGASALYDRVRGTRPGTPAGPVYETFRASYSATWSDDPADYAWAAHAWDASWIALYGVAWAVHNEDPGARGVARGLRRLSDGDAVEIRTSTWDDVQAAFEAGEGIDVSGASGDLDYDPVTEETTGPVDVWRISTDGTALETVLTCHPDGTCEAP